MLNFLSKKKMILTNIEWQFLNGKRNLMLIKMYDNMYDVLGVAFDWFGSP